MRTGKSVSAAIVQYKMSGGAGGDGKLGPSAPRRSPSNEGWRVAGCLPVYPRICGCSYSYDSPMVLYQTGEAGVKIRRRVTPSSNFFIIQLCQHGTWFRLRASVLHVGRGAGRRGSARAGPTFKNIFFSARAGQGRGARRRDTSQSNINSVAKAPFAL
eukprot:scaffold25459_cov30-Tisochrysis_lutea.AAC.2